MRTHLEAAICKVLLALFLFGASAGAFGQEEQTLTLNDAIRIGLLANPNLKAAEAQAQEALFAYHAAGSLPPLSLSGNYEGGNNTNATNNGRTQDVNVNVSQSFGALGNIGLAGKSGFQNYQISQAALGEAKLGLTQNIKDTFYTLLSAQEQLSVTEENLTLANELYDLTKKRFNAGAVPETDLLNADIQKASTEQALVQANAARKQAQSALNVLLGRMPVEPLKVTGKLRLSELALDLESLTKMARENRPLMKSSELAVELAETQVRLARTQHYPTPSLFYSYDFTTTPLYMVGASLALPIFDYGQIGNQIKVQEKTVQEKESARTNTLLGIFSSVKNNYEGYMSIYENGSTFREKVLMPSEKLMKATEYGYNRGALSYFQVLIAEQNLRSVRIQYINLLLSGHQAFDALEMSVGMPLEGNGP